MDDIWKDFELCKQEEEKTTQKHPTKLNLHICEHNLDYDGVCVKCGIVIDGYNISSSSEWNNYKNESGNYSTNTQRGDVYDDNNPYSKGGTLAFNTNTLIGKLQLQMTFNHKQKTYWLIGKQFEHVSSQLNINTQIIDYAKSYWHMYMESGRLTRASVRKGLIAACLYHSCIKKDFPVSREQILEIFECTTKTLSKGEKVLFEIIERDELIYKGTNHDEQSSFIKYCSLLELPYSLNNKCNIMYNKYKVQLQAVTPKSAVGGIIAYFIKNVLKLKKPSKTVISTTVDVCTPTINKVILILENLES